MNIPRTEEEFVKDILANYGEPNYYSASIRYWETKLMAHLKSYGLSDPYIEIEDSRFGDYHYPYKYLKKYGNLILLQFMTY